MVRSIAVLVSFVVAVGLVGCPDNGGYETDVELEANQKVVQLAVDGME